MCAFLCNALTVHAKNSGVWSNMKPSTVLTHQRKERSRDTDPPSKVRCNLGAQPPPRMLHCLTPKMTEFRESPYTQKPGGRTKNLGSKQKTRRQKLVKTRAFPGVNFGEIH